MRIFVTGSSGFIGSELCRQAETAGHEILRLESPHRLDALPLELLDSFKPEVAVTNAKRTSFVGELPGEIVFFLVILR